MRSLGADLKNLLGLDDWMEILTVCCLPNPVMRGEASKLPRLFIYKNFSAILQSYVFWIRYIIVIWENKSCIHCHFNCLLSFTGVPNVKKSRSAFWLSFWSSLARWTFWLWQKLKVAQCLSGTKCSCNIHISGSNLQQASHPVVIQLSISQSHAVSNWNCAIV